MPAKRMTATTATASSISGASGSTTNSNGPSGGGTRPLETLNGMTRLTPARDLTLGGRGAGAASKKVFAPNLNAVRNKNSNVKTSKDTTQPRSGRRGGRGNGTGATRGRGGNSAGGANSTLIQTQGLFSEGAGDVHVRRSTGNGTAYARGGEEVAVARKRVDRKDDKSQSERIKELLGESEASDAELSEDEPTKTEMALRPILLKEGLWVTQKTPIVKQEDASSSSTQKDTLAVAQHLQQLHVAAQVASLEEPPLQYGRYPRTIGNFLDSSQSQIFLMQLPDVLPCVGDDSEEPEPAKPDPLATSESEPSSPAAKSSTAAKGSVLRQLEEGQIGKILRFKSGRVKLQLGDTRFDLDMGLDPGFLQELMSVTANREQRSGNMINLGPIQAKLKATPDWVHLFEQQEAAAKRTNPVPGT
ncbi:DNA-directed RNA polymerase III subunit RPC4 [Drosophila subpulchrella]|uniref:DNA-directed RNA polymerase III subunit RPC4 n=1 Tax=Drosophila subpulchrella TaxID=1486046 RepID=UPI0018A162DA|nr:DNA-directed RNA polymerase III subunit RPC4 [Drosophila subpulchrella]